MASSVYLQLERINQRIEDAIMDALNNELKDGLLKQLKKSAEENVYSYPATARAMEHRRGTIGSEGVMESTTGGGGGVYYLRIHNSATTQNPAGDAEVDIVEEGYSNYKQPYPRPFMQNALDNFVNSGEAEALLQDALTRHGL